jgi:hypothetical protein
LAQHDGFCPVFLQGMLRLAKGVTKPSTRVEQPMSDHFKCSGQARSKGRAPLFLVSKMNLNSSYWRMWRTKNRQRQIRIEKVMTPQSKRGQELKNKQTTKHYKTSSQSSKKFFVCCYAANRVQR